MTAGVGCKLWRVYSSILVFKCGLLTAFYNSQWQTYTFGPCSLSYYGGGGWWTSNNTETSNKVQKPLLSLQGPQGPNSWERDGGKEALQMGQTMSQWAVFQLYSGRKQVQSIHVHVYKKYPRYIEIREGMDQSGQRLLTASVWADE